jgi:hypothetical protein
MATFPSKVNYATGDVLTATNMNDVGGALNLLESAQYAAGKNKIINGDFNVWQRGTTQSVTDNGFAYGSADRFAFARNGTIATGTNTVSRETHIVGQTEVPNNPTYYCRFTTTTLATGQTRSEINQLIENVGTFAGQTVTLSFYVRSSGTFGITTFLDQNFGSGGSTLVTTTGGTGNTSTSWQRFTTTVTLPSISGKTVGTSSNLRIILRLNNPTTGTTFDVSNVMLEAGSTASPFQTASGSIAGELALCQRYFTRLLDGRYIANVSGTSGMVQFIYPVFLRTSPTITTNITNANYGSVWTLSQTGVATSTKTGTVTITTTVSVISNAFALNLAGATYLPVPNAYESLSGAYFDISAEL